MPPARAGNGYFNPIFDFVLLSALPAGLRAAFGQKSAFGQI
jgi:hypothetical protein